MTTVTKSPAQSWHETARHTCKWHAQHGDERWAKAWLAQLEQQGDVTGDEAAAIREACGWVVQRALSLDA